MFPESGIFSCHKSVCQVFGHFGKRDDNPPFLIEFSDLPAVVRINTGHRRGPVVIQCVDFRQVLVQVIINACRSGAAQEDEKDPQDHCPFDEGKKQVFLSFFTALF
eukprot:Anaeramoba_ignava/a610878_11.p4 GENE.a610878_11~~a610878_11.p4  ORF type:complete len:106 (+),score=0.83 a610878_11:528-845(+)